MDNVQILSPLLGVMLGGALTGIGSHLRNRKERKRVLAAALCDLLEIRHRITSAELMLKELSSIQGLQKSHIPAIRTAFASWMPMDPKIDERYSASIDLLAGIAPILAFRLRSRNEIPKLLDKYRAFAEGTGVDPGLIESFEVILRTVVVPNLNNGVLQLARSHSLFTEFEVKRLIKKSESLTPAGLEFVDQVKGFVQSG